MIIAMRNYVSAFSAIWLPEVALVSDAGRRSSPIPLQLVRAARGRPRIYTLPGASAAIAALTLAGLPTDRFLFLGFPPGKARADAIAEVATIRATLVSRADCARQCLAALRDGLGAREAAVIREISKPTGDRQRQPCRAVRYADAPQEEIVIVIDPPAGAGCKREDLDDACAALVSMSPSAAADVAQVSASPEARLCPRAELEAAPEPAMAEARGRAETLAAWWLRLRAGASSPAARAGRRVD
jgi:16S rRNA (cytidine1402-2'-O)-methyltransferase